MGKTMWRPEPVIVDKVLDELWIAVKSQPSLVIAGSPRNAFKGSLRNYLAEVEH